MLSSVRRYEQYWAGLAQKPANKTDFILAVLGDSTMQAIGASRPEDGVAGKAAQLIERHTSQQVHVVNLSKSGARVAEVVDLQLPKLGSLQPDLILVSVGANDVKNKTAIQNYEDAYQALVGSLPRTKTIYANTPDITNRDDYEKVFQRTAKRKKMLVAPVYEKVYPHRNNPLIYGGDFFHPSSKGYAYWFEAYQPGIEELLR